MGNKICGINPSEAQFFVWEPIEGFKPNPAESNQSFSMFTLYFSFQIPLYNWIFLTYMMSFSIFFFPPFHTSLVMLVLFLSASVSLEWAFWWWFMVDSL
jgi:hypothetical protein